MQIKQLVPNADNPRTISPQKLAQLKKAMLKFGDLSGIVYNKKLNLIVGGHQRQQILDADSQITVTKKFSKPTKTGTVAEGFVEFNGEKFTYREVYWTENLHKAATIAANKNAGEWDRDKLSTWFKELTDFDANDFDIDLTMFDSDELKEFDTITVGEHTRTGTTGVDEDEVPEKAPARSKLGDLYLLGEHRLLCGDATNEKHVARLMKGQKADMVFTDPPYGVNFQYNGHKDERGIKYDKFIVDLYKNLENLGCPIIVTPGNVNLKLWLSLADFKPLFWLKKNSMSPGSFSHLNVVEIILVSGVKGKKRNTDLLEYTLKTQKDVGKSHPCPKQISLIEDLLESYAGPLVVDLFGGSGSTLIACEKTHRKCFMMEIDPHYCDVIVTRWEKYTGLEAKLVRPDTRTVKQMVHTSA